MWGSHNRLKRLGRLPRLPGNSTYPIFIRLHSHLISQTWMFPSKEEEASKGASLVFQCKSETWQQSEKSHNICNVIKWSPGECDPWLVRPPQNHPPSTGIPPPFREFRHTKSLSLVELFTFYQSRNILTLSLQQIAIWFPYCWLGFHCPAPTSHLVVILSTQDVEASFEGFSEKETPWDVKIKWKSKSE